MQFIKGEKKEVRIKIFNRKNSPFIIRNASFELFVWGQNVIESNGTAEIEDSEVFALVQPLNSGLYTLVFTYEIAQEILKASVQIEVR